MQTLRALTVLLILSSVGEVPLACTTKDDRSLGDGAGSSGRGGRRGSSTIVVTGAGVSGLNAASGNGGVSGFGAANGLGAASGSGATDPNAAAAGADGSDSCTFSGLGTCGGASLMAEPRIVNMLLVIDKSGSMTDSIGDEDKWTAMKSALAQSIGRVTTEINVGLELFPLSLTETIPLSCDTDCCTVPDGDAAVVVPVGPAVRALSDITDELATTTPGGGTPTAKALEGALDYFTIGAGASLKGQSYVLLATDGGPNCNPGLTCEAESCTTNLDGTDCGGGNCCRFTDTRDQCLDDAQVIAALDNLRDSGISTFVVGLPGTAQYGKYLDEFAQAGGEPNTAGSTQYYAVSQSEGVQGLIDVFDTITTQLIRSCTVPLTEPPTMPNLVNVAIDCDVVPPMSSDGSGWHFDDPNAPSEVVLDGPVCDRLQADGAMRVDVLFGCPTVR
jgi:hypothetical protein